MTQTIRNPDYLTSWTARRGEFTPAPLLITPAPLPTHPCPHAFSYSDHSWLNTSYQLKSVYSAVLMWSAESVNDNIL